jgi:hypothetical protein
MTVGRCLLLLGFVCLTIMVLTHIAETLRLFSGMGAGAWQTVPATTSILPRHAWLCAFDRWHDLDLL